MILGSSMTGVFLNVRLSLYNYVLVVMLSIGLVVRLTCFDLTRVGVGRLGRKCHFFLVSICAIWKSSFFCNRTALRVTMTDLPFLYSLN